MRTISTTVHYTNEPQNLGRVLLQMVLEVLEREDEKTKEAQTHD